jgi:hypothetical protein
VLKGICQGKYSFVVFFYLLVQILFNSSQVHAKLFIHLNLVVLSTNSLGKLIEGIVWLVIHKVVTASWSHVLQRPLEVCNFRTLLGNTIDFYRLFEHMYMNVWVWIHGIFEIFKSFLSQIKIYSYYCHRWHGWVPWKIGISIGWYSTPSWRY